MISNYHTHTPRCRHARGAETEYIQAARERGLKILGFSDHTVYPFPGGYCSSFRMPVSAFEDYYQTVKGLQNQPDLEILLGLEVEYYPAYLPELLAILRDHPLDYAILGQHFLGNELGDFYSGNLTDDVRHLIRYCDQTIEAMETGLFTYFAHPDLIGFTGDHRVYREQMRRICKAAKACGIPLEVNFNGLDMGRHYPNPRFWELAAEENCDVVLGIDAHEPELILDRSLETRALDMLSACGITPMDTVPLRPVGR